MITIDVANQQTVLPVDPARIKTAVQAILSDQSIRQGEISVAVVDDPTIHKLNRQYLDHDYPTDVLSFLLERSGDCLEGEVIVSAQTARASAGEFGFSTEQELLLYVIHGVLHLVGYDDATPRQQAEMCNLQREYLARVGFQISDCSFQMEGPNLNSEIRKPFSGGRKVS